LSVSARVTAPVFAFATIHVHRHVQTRTGRYDQRHRGEIDHRAVEGGIVDDYGNTVCRHGQPINAHQADFARFGFQAHPFARRRGAAGGHLFTHQR
jgi:hypothetical protein